MADCDTGGLAARIDELTSVRNWIRLPVKTSEMDADREPETVRLAAVSLGALEGVVLGVR